MTEIFRDRMVRIHISIPESLDDDMRDFIAISNHRYEKGPISSLVADAVRKHLDACTHTKKRLKKYDNSKYDDLMVKIEAYLVPKYRYQEFNNIPEKHIDEAISAIRDIHDKRPIKGWRNRLEIGGYIERKRESKVFRILR